MKHKKETRLKRPFLTLVLSNDKVFLLGTTIQRSIVKKMDEITIKAAVILIASFNLIFLPMFQNKSFQVRLDNVILLSIFSALIIVLL